MSATHDSSDFRKSHQIPSDEWARFAVMFWTCSVDDAIFVEPCFHTDVNFTGPKGSHYFQPGQAGFAHLLDKLFCQGLYAAKLCLNRNSASSTSDHSCRRLEVVAMAGVHHLWPSTNFPLTLRSASMIARLLHARGLEEMRTGPWNQLW